MGSTRLKKKDELHYRRGSTNESVNCSHCAHYVRDFEVKAWVTEEVIRTEPRCRVMGLKSSMKYRVRPDHTCDSQKLSDYHQKQLDQWAKGFKK